MIIYKQLGNDLLIETTNFSLEQTLDCGQAFRFKQENGFWSGVVNNQLLVMKQEQNGVLFKNMSMQNFKENFFEYFTLNIDYAKLIEQFSQDETFKKAIDYAGGIRILKQDKWETVCSFIFSQNNNIPRIKGIIDRFCENFGTKIDDNNYSFPKVETIANLTVEDLAPIRAGFRAKYIIDAAQKIYSKEVDLDTLETLPLDIAREELKKIKGIGDKVADCVLLFSCAHYNAFPIDVWIKRVMAVLYPNGLPECAKKYQGIAQQYLFHYAREIKLKDQTK